MGMTARLPKDLALVLLGGILYVTTIFLRGWITPQLSELLFSGTQAESKPVLVGVLVRLPSLAAILYAWAQRDNADIRAALKGETLGKLAAVVLGTVIVTILLNNSILWPFSWRWPGDSSLAYMNTLIVKGNWSAIGLWLILAVGITPVLEEIVFRFGLLQLLWRASSSVVAAVVGSSLIFGILHLGYLPPDRAHVINAFWVFVFSNLLGFVTVRKNGNIRIALVVHTTFNLVTWLFLVVAAQRSLPS
jgi:membrane protease YdiL (CAAX protease family)